MRQRKPYRLHRQGNFEREMCAYIGVPHATALHLALLLLGVKPGDEVLCATLTFSASANAIVYAGAERGRRPGAVMTVDLYGQCADYERIEEICRRYEVPLIEDSAEALGATCNGKKAGCFGRAAVFSFNGNKIIMTSGGGMLVSSDGELIRKARASWPPRRGTRRRNCELYREALGGVPGIAFMPEAEYGRSNRWLTCITVEPEEFGATREDIRLALEAENIEARPMWKPMHLQPVFAACRRRGGDTAAELFDKGLCLPSGSSLREEDMERVAGVVVKTGKL